MKATTAQNTTVECNECENKFAVSKETITNQWDEYSDCPACGRMHHHGPNGEL